MSRNLFFIVPRASSAVALPYQGCSKEAPNLKVHPRPGTLLATLSSPLSHAPPPPPATAVNYGAKYALRRGSDTVFRVSPRKLVVLEAGRELRASGENSTVCRFNSPCIYHYHRYRGILIRPAGGEART